MQRKTTTHLLSVTLLILIFVLSACSTLATAPTPTNTPNPPTATATITATPTKTLVPTYTPRPTATPNLAATQKYEGFDKEIQSYYHAGYLNTTKGTVKELEDFSNSWAQLGYYAKEPTGIEAADFFISSHFKWESAYANADTSGCGYVFSLQPNGDHYAVFLDRSKIIFAITSNRHGRVAGPTRGTARVKFGNPAEADFTIIVKGNYAYALVDGQVVSEYTLAQSRMQKGEIALSILSGTNKDYGTSCEMTNLHVWLPKE